MAIVAPVFIIGSMYPIFQLASRTWGYEIGWFLGMAIYWLVWGFAYPFRLMGKETIRDLIKPQKLSLGIFFMVLFPLIMSLLIEIVFWHGIQLRQQLGMGRVHLFSICQWVLRGDPVERDLYENISPW